jgi:hypothetical protein
MSDKAVYIKDNDEPCQLCKEQSGFCHIHSHSTSERSESELEDTSSNEDAETSAAEFSAEDAPNHCPECENPIRVHSAALEQQWHNPNRVNIKLRLKCECAEADIANTPTVAASELPEQWL